jgi:hypothetical protein
VANRGTLVTAIARLGVSFIVLAAGCAGYSKGIRPDEKLSAESAYLYGRFFITSEQSAVRMHGYPTIELVVRCADGASYPTWFSTENVVQVIKIKPANCALIQVAFTDADGTVLGYRPAPLAWVRGEDFVPGRADYVGDFVAKATFRSDWKKLHWHWGMNPVDDGYEPSTAEMKRKFVNLAALPADDRRFAPRRPPGPLLAVPTDFESGQP